MSIDLVGLAQQAADLAASDPAIFDLGCAMRDDAGRICLADASRMVAVECSNGHRRMRPSCPPHFDAAERQVRDGIPMHCAECGDTLAVAFMEPTG